MYIESNKFSKNNRFVRRTVNKINRNFECNACTEFVERMQT